jgi:hypothetical protein
MCLQLSKKILRNGKKKQVNMIEIRKKLQKNKDSIKQNNLFYGIDQPFLKKQM